MTVFTDSQRPQIHTHEDWFDIVMEAWHNSTHRPDGPARLEVHPCTALIGDTGLIAPGYEVLFTFPSLLGGPTPSVHRFVVLPERPR